MSDTEEVTEKFTAGPWYADAEGNIWRRQPSDLYENGGTVAGDRPLAKVYKGWYEADQEGFPVEANAHLIAAAPQLYEALEINADIGKIWGVIDHIPPDHAVLLKWLGAGTGYEAPEVRIQQLVDKAVKLRNVALSAAAPGVGGE